jgi:hypothetical protein
MKTLLSARRIAFLAFALGTASVTATFAQTTTTPDTTTTTPPATSAPAGTTGGWKHRHHESVLTADEKARLKAAREQAFAADPSLKTEHDSLRQQFKALRSSGTTPTSDQKQALHQQASDFHQKLQAAELKIDPTLAPVFDKLAAAHHGRHSNS